MPRSNASTDTGGPATGPLDVALGKRLTAFGRPAAGADGTLATDLEAQMQGAWSNLFDALHAAGFERHHLIKTTVSVTEGGQLQLYRRVRDRMLRGHRTANSYLHVSDLRLPGQLVEIEGVAVKS
jgi:enamine deaminase RidA (YjgF/YER057c/UK114 family)